MIQPNSNMYATERLSSYTTGNTPSQHRKLYTNASADASRKTQGVPLGRTASLTTPESMAPLHPDTVHVKRKTTLGDKVIGTAESLAGRVVNNQGMIERGRIRKGM